MYDYLFDANPTGWSRLLNEYTLSQYDGALVVYLLDVYGARLIPNDIYPYYNVTSNRGIRFTDPAMYTWFMLKMA